MPYYISLETSDAPVGLIAEVEHLFALFMFCEIATLHSFSKLVATGAHDDTDPNLCQFIILLIIN